MADRLIDIAGELRGETEKALRIYYGSRTEWVPKRYVEDKGDGTFTMPEWLVPTLRSGFAPWIRVGPF